VAWQAVTGYSRRAPAKTAFQRYEFLIGRSRRTRTLSAQKVEAGIACKMINRMTSLGIRVSRKVAGEPAQRAKSVINAMYAPKPC
jgi:hypothetical protein